MVAASEGFA